MTTDALGRRLRHAAPQPRLARLVPTEADLLLFEAIDRHGPLPTHYLYELTRHARGNLANLKHRLTQMYNGADGKPYLTRPAQQFASFHARYQHLVYDIAPRARTLLAERGTLSRYPPVRSGSFVHQLMQACVAASFEITAPTLGLRYISRADILGRESCPARLTLAPMNIPLGGGRSLIPDDLFGMEYPGEGFRFFALEVDRATESIERSLSGQSAFGRKLTSYLHILRHRLYREHWGIPNLTVLTVTTNATHAENMVGNLRGQEAGSYVERFLSAVEPNFGANWRVPRGVLRSLLRADGGGGRSTKY